jgi:hypothetical protein
VLNKLIYKNINYKRTLHDMSTLHTLHRFIVNRLVKKNMKEKIKRKEKNKKLVLLKEKENKK